MDRYGNAIYLTPMVLGALVSICAAAWRFLGVRQAELNQMTLDKLFAFAARIRKTDDEAELAAIEDEVDSILRARLVGPAGKEGSDESDIPVLIAAAQRIDNLVHHRRAVLTAKAVRIVPIA